MPACGDLGNTPQTEQPDAVGKVRGIARDRISPVPLLYPQTIPLDPTADPARVALAVYVPPEQETPFITQGTIYRRIHDSSDPVPESDRYAVDRLIEAGRDARTRFEQFCRDERLVDPTRASLKGG